MEFVSSIIGTDAVGRHLGYLFHYTDNVDELRNQVVKLRDARDRVKGKIDDASRKGEIIQAGVKSWISKLDDTRVDVEKFLKDEAEENKNGLGWLITRYRLGKEAQKKTKLVISLLQEEGEFESVSRPPPPPGIIFSSKGIFEAFESRKSIMNGVMEALNDQNTSIVGICGMGGVGKTTLVTEIAKRVKDKLFKEVVMVTVSQNPSLTKIQEELATRLGLPPLANDESARASRLWERIKAQKQILVILDDAWERIDLMKIGIPFGIDHQGCKILLTSRNKGVCDAMEAREIFSVKILSEKESWLLFEEAAGPVVHNSDINPVARKVVAECGGLPIAILTVGRALRNKDKYTWEAAALQLKKSTPTIIDGMQKNVISSLELSYNYLETEVAKSLFLFCCLFPEDYYIDVDMLAIYGMGLRWFKNVDTVEEARFEAHAVIISLVDLPSMTHIWKGDIQSISLDSLQRVHIEDCNKLVNIFTTAIVKSLVLLKELIVNSCSEMREIMTDEESEKSTSTEKIVFPNLSCITIFGLDNITCFCSGQYPIEFPALEILRITDCPKMKTFGNGNQVTPKLKEVNLQHNWQWNGDLNNTVKQFYQLDMIKKEQAMKIAENKADQEISGSDAKASIPSQTNIKRKHQEILGIDSEPSTSRQTHVKQRRTF